MKRILCTLLFVVTVLSASAQKPTAIELWPYGAPHKGAEGDSAIAYVYLPSAKKATGRAVVICPGGGYSNLTLSQKHTDWANFFTAQGIAAIVLRYRLPHGDCRVPVEDAVECMEMVRRNAEAWHLRTDEIGIMGCSAGGHLASTLATHAKKEKQRPCAFASLRSVKTAEWLPWVLRYHKISENNVYI